MHLSDNNPLTYVMKSVKLNAAGHRWVVGSPSSTVLDQQIEISYQEEESPLMQECRGMPAGCHTGKDLEREKTGEASWVSPVTCNVDALPEGGIISETIQPFAVDNVRDAQNADAAINRILSLKRS